MKMKLSIIEKEIVKQFPTSSKNTLILNCYQGHLAHQIKEQYPSTEVTGVLFQKELNVDANQNVQTLYQSIDSLPDKKYDCIIFSQMHTFLQDPLEIKLLKNKYLAKDGICFFDFYNSQFMASLDDMTNSGLKYQFSNFGFQNIYPYNMVVLRTVLSMFKLDIVSLMALVTDEFNRLESNQPVIGYRRDALELNIPDLYLLFSYYFLIKAQLVDDFPSELKELSYDKELMTVELLRFFHYSYPQIYWEQKSKFLPFHWKNSNLFLMKSQAISERLKELPIESILDVGCGSGLDLKVIHAAFHLAKKDVRLVGTDISSGMLKSAQKDMPKNQVELIKCEIGKPLNFDSKSFDCVMTSNVLSCSYPEDYEVLLGEVERLARKYILHFEYLNPEHAYFFSNNIVNYYRSKGYHIEFLTHVGIESLKNQKPQFFIVHLDKGTT